MKKLGLVTHPLACEYYFGMDVKGVTMATADACLNIIITQRSVDNV